MPNACVGNVVLWDLVRNGIELDGKMGGRRFEDAQILEAAHLQSMHVHGACQLYKHLYLKWIIVRLKIGGKTVGHEKVE